MYAIHKQYIENQANILIKELKLSWYCHMITIHLFGCMYYCLPPYPCKLGGKITFALFIYLEVIGKFWYGWRVPIYQSHPPLGYQGTLMPCTLHHPSWFQNLLTLFSPSSQCWTFTMHHHILVGIQKGTPQGSYVSTTSLLCCFLRWCAPQIYSLCDSMWS